MDVLNSLVRSFQNKSLPKLDNILFVCTQHLLPTSVMLFDALIQLGANPNNMFIIGKQYSACPSVVDLLLNRDINVHKLTPLCSLGNYKTTFENDLDEMWQTIKINIKKNNFDMMIVLDDGGRNLEYVYNDISINIPIIGVEQTTAGLLNPHVLALSIPFIDVASSAAKIFIEPRIIAYEILTKLIDHLPKKTKGLNCGVIGLGTIGTAVTKKLLELGCDISFYDRREINKPSVITEAIQINNLEDLIKNNDYIFGCTGRDVSKLLNIEKVMTNNKTFISCSSEDKEFLTLLKYIETIRPDLRNTPLETLFCQLENGNTVTVLSGGFPINFDRTREIAPPEMIQITRGLLLGAIVQAIIMKKEFNCNNYSDCRIALDPLLQNYIVNIFRQPAQNLNLWSDDLFDKFNDINWIASNSSGLQLNLNCFSKFTKLYTEPDVSGLKFAAI